MSRALSIGALLACHGPPAGYTLCGQSVYGASSAEVEALNVAEVESLRAIQQEAKRKDGSPMQAHEVCRQLWGVRLELSDDLGHSKTCECEVPPKLCGTTHLGPDGDVISLLRLPWESVCLAHEQLHLAQMKLDGEADPKHEKWRERGYFAAEHVASARIAEAL